MSQRRGSPYPQALSGLLRQSAGGDLPPPIDTSDREARIFAHAMEIITILPVVHEGRLLGAIDKWALLAAVRGEGPVDAPLA